jgi:hypothetical protein
MLYKCLEGVYIFGFKLCIDSLKLPNNLASQILFINY